MMAYEMKNEIIIFIGTAIVRITEETGGELHYGSGKKAFADAGRWTLPTIVSFSKADSDK